MRHLPLVGVLVTTALLASCTQESTGPAAPGLSDTPVEAITPLSAGSGGITIVLDMQPNRPTDVAFEAKGPRLRSFVLDDDVTSALASSRTVTRLKAGTYTVQLGALAGLTLLDLTCQSSGTDNNTIDLANRSVAISLEAGESVTCTFVGSLPIWHEGDGITYAQGVWSDDPTASALLTENYAAVYASTSGILEVGIPGAAGFSVLFTGSLEVLAFLPATVGTSGPLTSDLVDPTTTSSGPFGGEVTALHLNIDFSDAEILLGTSGIPFGNLTLCSFSDLPALNGMTVRQIRGVANTLLGGGSGIVTIAQVEPVVRGLNFSFTGGGINQFAQDHLVNGACP